MLSFQVYFTIISICGYVVFSSGNYAKKPKNDQDLHTHLKSSFMLTCSYEGRDSDGEFLEWYKDDIPISSEKQGHYQVKTEPTVSTLNILIFVSADASVNSWYVKSRKSGYEDKKICEFKQIRLVSSPQAIMTDREKETLTTSHESVRRVEEESITFKCIVKPEPQSDSSADRVKWEFSNDGHNFFPIEADGVKIANDQIMIEPVKKIHRGYYQCMLNDIRFTVQLRVKDRLAALWPFLGIVSIVLVLVIIILIFEKRQNSTRRQAAHDEDDHDHANDPLVRVSNKSADNDNKKRTVKA